MKSILDKDFKYVPSFNTDVKKTIERAKKAREAVQPKSNVEPLRKKVK